MNKIVVLSEDDKIYFSFGERCLYINDVPKDEKLEGYAFLIYEYLVENSPYFKTHNQIYDALWVDKDPPYSLSTLRGYIGTIRKYLGDCTNQKQGKYKYIEARKEGKDMRCRSLQGFSSQNDEAKTPKSSSAPVPKTEHSDIDEEKFIMNAAHVISKHFEKEMDEELRDDIRRVLHGVIMQVTLEVWQTFDLSKKFEKIFERYAEVLEFVEMLSISNSKK